MKKKNVIAVAITTTLLVGVLALNVSKIKPCGLGDPPTGMVVPTHLDSN